MSSTPDEVEQLADALKTKWNPLLFDKLFYGPQFFADVDTLARAAAAVGARTALEAAPHDPSCRSLLSPDPAIWFPGFKFWCDCDQARALNTYTTDEETKA